MARQREDYRQGEMRFCYSLLTGPFQYWTKLTFTFRSHLAVGFRYNAFHCSQGIINKNIVIKEDKIMHHWFLTGNVAFTEASNRTERSVFIK